MTVPAVAFPLTGMAAALVPTVHFYLSAHLFPLLGYVFWKAGAEFHSLWYLPSCSNIEYLFFSLPAKNLRLLNKLLFPLFSSR